MRKSLYRQIMFTISIICLILLIIIAVKIGVFSELTLCIWFERILSICNNNYFISIISSIASIVIIYFFQVQYSKIKLKKDLICNEIIQDVYIGIENYFNIKNTIPEKTNKNTEKDYTKRQKSDGLLYYKFYKKNEAAFIIISYNLSDLNTDILIESLQSCFFINLNFNLLSIVNNIKNRLANIRNAYPEIKEMCKKYESDNDEDTLMRIGNRFPHYLIDLQFMAIYWKELLDYLNYDPTYIKLFVQTYNSQYDI